jgi:Pregnancy-associated plasma protein-A
MKILFRLFLLAILFVQTVAAQTINDCGTKLRSPKIHHDSLTPLVNLDNFTTPYPIRIFIHVFADDNGTNRAAPDTSILRQINNMKTFYATHSICFIVAGIEQVNSSTLNYMRTDLEEADLASFLVADCIDIFVHTTLRDNSGTLNGMAYDIPNTYLSIVSTAVMDSVNISTLAHEMGHCLGLYHTFQTWEDGDGNTVRELKNRSGVCSNCSAQGDLLCDTEADRDNPESSINATSCNYTGSQVLDACNNALVMAPTNIMTYGRRGCRSVFTNGQGNRARSFLLSQPSLSNCIAEDNETISTNQTVSSGRRLYVARNQVTISTTQLTFTNSARVNFSARQVTVPPGTIFSPGTTLAYVEIRVGTACQ